MFARGLLRVCTFNPEIGLQTSMAWIIWLTSMPSRVLDWHIALYMMARHRSKLPKGQRPAPWCHRPVDCTAAARVKNPVEMPQLQRVAGRCAGNYISNQSTCRGRFHFTSTQCTGTYSSIDGICHKYHFCRDKSFVVNCQGMATKVLWRQTRVCGDKIRLLSRQKYACCDKTFVVTKLCLSRQTYFCCDKHNFVATKDVFCCDESKHVVIKRFCDKIMQLPPMIIFSFSKSALVQRFVSVWFTFAVWAARVHIPFSKRSSLTTDGKLPRNSGTLVGDKTLLLLVISEETVGNSWDILYSILGHKYHQNHPNRAIRSK